MQCDVVVQQSSAIVMGDDRNKRFHESTAKCLVDTACCVELTVNIPVMSELLLINLTGLEGQAGRS